MDALVDFLVQRVVVCASVRFFAGVSEERVEFRKYRVIVSQEVDLVRLLRFGHDSNLLVRAFFQSSGDSGDRNTRMSREILLEPFRNLVQELPYLIKGINLLGNFFLQVLEELKGDLMRQKQPPL